MSEHNQQFDTFQQWVNKASSWLRRMPLDEDSDAQAICFDAQGRICRIGGDFMRARDENQFPVRWIWPTQVGRQLIARENVIEGDERIRQLEAEIERLKSNQGFEFRRAIIRALVFLDTASPSKRNGPLYQAADALRKVIDLPPTEIGCKFSHGVAITIKDKPQPEPQDS